MVGLVVNGRGFSRLGGTRLLGAVLVDTVLVTSTGGTTGALISSIGQTLDNFFSTAYGTEHNRNCDTNLYNRAVYYRTVHLVNIQFV